MTDSPQNFQSDKSFVLDTLKIHSSTGQTVDITFILAALTIFEDLYSPVMSGEVIVNDALSLLTEQTLIGFEFLEMKLKKPGPKQYETNKMFRIYKVDNLSVNFSSQKNMSYCLKFCSEELLLSQGMKISKGFSGKLISEIVQNIVERDLKAKLSNLIPTTGLYDIVIPYWSPFRAIQWLTTRATTIVNNTETPFMFFENGDGFNFVSMNYLMKAYPKKQFFYSPQNVSPMPQIGPDPSNGGVPDEPSYKERNVIKFEFTSYTDVLESMTSGMYASSLKTFDPIRLMVSDYRLNYKDYFEKTKDFRLDDKPSPFVNNFVDRMKEQITDKSMAVRRFYPTTKDLDSDGVISKKQKIKPNNVEKWMLQKIQKMEDLNYFKIKLLIPGDNEIKAGDTIIFTMPKIDQKPKNKNEEHPYYQGKYLVTAVRHMVTNKSYEMAIEGVKDGVFNSYPSSRTSEPELK